jgi:hypothetical protein
MLRHAELMLPSSFGIMIVLAKLTTKRFRCTVLLGNACSLQRTYNQCTMQVQLSRTRDRVLKEVTIDELQELVQVTGGTLSATAINHQSHTENDDGSHRGNSQHSSTLTGKHII